MKLVDIDKVVNKRSSFVMNDTRVVTIISKIDDNYFLNINLNKKGKSFYNFFNRELEYIDDNYYIKELWIEHPPYYFHRADICVNGTLDIFWDKVVNSLYEGSLQSDIIPKHLGSDEKSDGIYFSHFKSLAKNHQMSENVKAKLLNIIGNNDLDYIIKSENTAVFTNDLKKAKSLKMAIKKMKK